MHTEIPQEFIDLARDRLLRQRGDATIETVEGGLLFEAPGHLPSRLNLHNLWRSIDAWSDQRPSDLTGALDDWARKMVAGAGVPQPISPEQLRVVVRAPEVVDAVGEHSSGVPLLRAIPGVGTLLAADVGKSYRYLTEDALTETGLDGMDAFDRAFANTLEEIEPQLRRHDGVVKMFTCGGHFESSLMLIDSLWDREEEALGPIVVAIPARDLVLWAPMQDADAVAELERQVKQAFDRDVPYLLSPLLYQRTPAGWRVWGSVVQDEKACEPVMVRPVDLQALMPEGAITVWPLVPGFDIALREPGSNRFIATHDDIKSSWQAALTARRSRMRAHRVDHDGISTFTDPGGPTIDVALFSHVLVDLGEELAVGFPTADTLIAAPVDRAEEVRRQVLAAYDDAGEDALTATLYRHTEEGLTYFDGAQDCWMCERDAPASAEFCPHCGDSLTTRIMVPWAIESAAAALVTSGAFWTLGAVTRPFGTTLMIWALIWLYGWIPRAWTHGQTTAQALAPWTQGVGRWMITIGCLASVARGGMLFDLLTNGPKDASG
ncbi:MAG: hypothetical protein KC912_20880, partial [Proteobacteria bacterium]|nr:hypothetical protein [Pseudomonadota bacterium]